MSLPTLRICLALPFLSLFMSGVFASGIDSPRLGDHPLAGTLWWAETGEPAGRQDVLAAIGEADIVMLGESHGNPDHHALQLELLEAMTRAGRRPAVAFEIFDLADQPVIDALRREGASRADALADAVGMSARGWDWPAYRPLVQFALDRNLPILAVNLSRKDAMDVARHGLATLSEEVRVRLMLDRPLPPSAQARLKQRLVDGHCGHLPSGRVDGMIAAQRARDAAMAERLAEVDGPVVFITGAGHARLDYGVPWYLAQHNPAYQSLSIVFMEVVEGREAIPAYLDDGATAHHLVWFTRRSSPDDPCEAFRRQLEGMGK